MSRWAVPDSHRLIARSMLYWLWDWLWLAAPVHFTEFEIVPEPPLDVDMCRVVPSHQVVTEGSASARLEAPCIKMPLAAMASTASARAVVLMVVPSLENVLAELRSATSARLSSCAETHFSDSVYFLATAWINAVSVPKKEPPTDAAVVTVDPPAEV